MKIERPKLSVPQQNVKPIHSIEKTGPNKKGIHNDV